MANWRIPRLRYVARRSLVGLLFPLSFATAAPLGEAPGADPEWRERHVWGNEADVHRHAGKAWARARAGLAAARAQGNFRQELRAAARYFVGKGFRSPDDCPLFTHYASAARSAGPSYDRELFDLGAATAWTWVEQPCPAHVSAEQMAELASKLGDPARMYYVLETQAAEHAMADRWDEVTSARSRQIEYAIAPFQRAFSFWQLSEVELGRDATSTVARIWLNRAAREIDAREFTALAAHIDANLAIVDLRADNADTAMKTIRRLVPLFRSGLTQGDANAVNLMSFANHLIRLNQVPEALEMLQESLRYRLTEPKAVIARASIFLAAYAKLGTPAALAKGEQEVKRIEEIVARAPDKMLRRPIDLRRLADFHASFGKYEQAYRFQEQLVAAMEDQQERSSNTARIELQEKLDVALKDQENTRLKAEAELQAERQRGWIVGFAAVAVGAVAAAAALAIAVRRGRRLAKVSAELADRNDELEQRSASRIRLLAAACHDLRQPAHALGMLAELGSDANAEPTRYTTWLQSVRRSTASLGDMLDELMDLGRLDGGHYTPHVSDVSLGELLQEVMLHFGPLAKRKGLTLEAPPVNFLVVSDRHLLRRMLFNLVSNAIKYTDTGSVSVGTELFGDELLLTVQDTGPGIPQDKLDDVFRDYVRLNPLKAAEGLGIGLSIVRRSADLLGHRLTLVSPPTGGTTVTLTLPISTSEMATEPGESLADAVALADAVLVILEDDADVRDAMAALLRRWHYTVFAAPDADAVLADLARMQAHPSLVITDLHLGATDGLKEVARLREAFQAPELPALLVTGDLDATVARQAEAAHVFVAHKPLAPRKLAELVGQLAHADAGSGPWTAVAPAPAPFMPR